MIQEKAKSLYDNLKQKEHEGSNAEEFKASKGWSDNFRKKVWLKKCQGNRGSSTPVNQKATYEFPDITKKITGEKDSCLNRFLMQTNVPYSGGKVPQRALKENVSIKIWGRKGCWCCCPVAKLCLTLWDVMDCSMPGSSSLHYLPEFAQIHDYWVSDAIWLSHPLPPPPFASHLPRIRVFSNESALCMRWSKYWSFSIGPSNEYSGVISFMTDRFDLLAVQVTLKSLLQHHSWKALILRHSAFFLIQLWHLYMTSEKP